MGLSIATPRGGGRRVAGSEADGREAGRERERLGSQQVIGIPGRGTQDSSGGRLQSRHWVRTAAGVTNRVGTTYTHDAAGDLGAVAYANDPSSTLGVKYIRDRLGRLRQAERHTCGVTGPNVTDANRVNYATLAYHDAGEPLTEAYSGGTLAGLSMECSCQYNAANQRTRATLADGSYWVYQYDWQGRRILKTACVWTDDCRNQPRIARMRAADR